MVSEWEADRNIKRVKLSDKRMTAIIFLFLFFINLVIYSFYLFGCLVKFLSCGGKSL